MKCLLILVMFLIGNLSAISYARTATVPINITVNGVFRVIEEVEESYPNFHSLKIRTNLKIGKLLLMLIYQMEVL